MNFWNTLKATFFDTALYERVQHEPLQKAITFFLKLGAIGFLITALTLIFVAIPFVLTVDVMGKIEAVYPDDLVMTIQDGELRINQPEPYYIPDTLDIPEIEHLAIFDGGDTLSASPSENSAIILVKRKFLITGTASDQDIVSFSEMGSTTVTKSDVLAITQKMRPYVVPVGIIGSIFIGALLVILGTVFWVLFHMIYILLPAAIIYIFGLIQKPQKGFAEMYKLTLYASAPVAILSFVSMQFGLLWPLYVYTGLVVIVAAIVLSRLSKPAAPVENVS